MVELKIELRSSDSYFMYFILSNTVSKYCCEYCLVFLTSMPRLVLDIALELDFVPGKTRKIR